jgi:amidase
VQSAVADAAKLLEELGHDVAEDEPRIDREALVEAYLVQVAASVAVEIDDAARWIDRKATPDGFEASTWFLAQLGRMYSAADLTRLRDRCHAASRLMAGFHQNYDLFLNGVLAYPPVEIGEIALKPAERVGLAVLRKLPVRKAMDLVATGLAEKSFERTANTMLFNMTGQPAMSVPLSWNAAGLPVGVQLVAPFGDEATLFRVAAQLEQARPWAGRRPSVCYASG